MISSTLHNELFGQNVFPPTELAETYLKIYALKKSFHIYLSQLVRLEGKLDFQGNSDFKTLNLGFLGHFDQLWVFQKIVIDQTIELTLIEAFDDFSQ